MWAVILRALGYVLGAIGGVSLVLAVIFRLFIGSTTTLAGVRASSLVEFSGVCLIFSAAFGVGAIVEILSQKKT